jgi:hypothetical protein
MDDFVSKVAQRLKLSKEQTRKLRTTAQIAGADTESKVEAVLAGLQQGEANVATATQALMQPVDYPSRVDECPICYANMTPVTIAGARPAFFCPIHNVCMPSTE